MRPRGAAIFARPPRTTCPRTPAWNMNTGSTRCANAADAGDTWSKKEVAIRGRKAVDVVATKGNKPIGIQIEAAKSDRRSGPRKRGRAGFERVVAANTERYSRCTARG